MQNAAEVRKKGESVGLETPPPRVGGRAGYMLEGGGSWKHLHQEGVN